MKTESTHARPRNSKSRAKAARAGARNGAARSSAKNGAARAAAKNGVSAKNGAAAKNGNASSRAGAKKKPAPAPKSPRARVQAVAKKRVKRAPKAAPFTAKTADKHVLYQMSVQDAAVEVDFIAGAFSKFRKRKALSLREDFCGTALICSHWVKSDPKRTATGIDIDSKVLAWGKANNIAPLAVDQGRVQLLQQDVRGKIHSKVDAVCAFNFSYWIFTTRDSMREYFKKVRAGLVKDGIFCLDSYGGWEAMEPMLEQRNIKRKFTYVWDQDLLDPITHKVVNYIHFEFNDGTKLNKAFRYEWRYWSLPELQELLLEAGFKSVHVYWDQSDDDDDEDYRPTLRAENQPGWLAYLVALN
ncbi:MAG TPA: class I SAM-dependent methyltransferase [Polyangiaceae bacterium]|nr:class I SAM-dependent methyltransferase [Polyangiaceae bacterium]